MSIESRGAGEVVHDRAVVADEAVEQRGLADVRPTDDGDGEDRVVDRGFGFFLRERVDDRVEEVAAPPSVHRRHRPRLAETEALERPHVGLAPFVVDLVDDDEHRLVRLVQHARDALVLLHETDGAVDHEEDHVGVDQRALGLTADHARERLAAFTRLGSEPTTGVDDHELAAVPLGVELLAIARDARLLLDDRVATTDKAVDEGGLAHVRATDDGDDRFRAHDVTAATSDAPSVATTSTEPGQFLGRRAVEEAAVREDDVGQQVAGIVRGGGGVEGAGDIGAGQQAGDGDVAAEELVVDHQQRHVGAAVASSSTSGSRTCAPYSPVTMLTGARLEVRSMTGLEVSGPRGAR